jgi:small subunit ribosomal protein S8
MDTIGDYLTIIRNAIKAKKKIVELPFSNFKTELTKILYEKGYILNYKVDMEKTAQGVIKIALKYDPVSGLSAIRKLTRVSTPGLRKYAGSKELPRIINGLGIAIISTSNGIMTNKEAKANNIGGEVICYIY